jgi:hypothetical protein
MSEQKFPPGWDEARVKRLVDHYENMDEDELLAEDEAARASVSDGDNMGVDGRAEFEQAMGETFGYYLSPPVPFEDASPHECCEVVWKVAGTEVTPTILASLSEAQIVALSVAFGSYFETVPPTVERIKHAIAGTLARWPVGSMGETLNPVDQSVKGK